jgi:uncharacterized protein (DUF2141 family)
MNGVRMADLKVGLYVLALSLLPAGLVLAQRDAPTTTAPSGTARISGVVMSVDAPPKPVPRVIVTLSGGEIPGGRTAISDDQGQFAFERLPAGRFTLSGTRPAYLTATYGANKPGRPGIPLQVSAGQQLTGVTLAIAHGAAITGVLRDQNGDAVSDMAVAALRFPQPGSPLFMAFADSATTDDRGVYRIYGLTAGDYVVAALPKSFGTGDLSLLSSTEIDDALRALQQRVGQTAGPSPSTAPAAPAPAMTPSAPPATSGQYAYAPVFYPGTASAAAARKVTVGISDERADVDFVVQLTRMATMSGTLVGPDGGAPQQVGFVIHPEGVQLPSLVGTSPTFSSEATPTGRTFTYTNLAPGRYVVTAQSALPIVRWARVEVDMTGGDVTGLAMVLQPALTVSGRIVFDGTMAPPDVTAVRLNLAYANGLGSGRAGMTNLGNIPVPPAAIDADGQFSISGVVPETFRIATTVPGPAGWWLRSAMVGKEDVLDVPLVIGASGNIAGVVLTFSDRHTTLTGTLQTPSGQPAPAYSIVVFPADRSLWRPLARRIQSARTGTDGTWTMKDLPPGDYLVAALRDLDPDDLLDPSFFDALAGTSTKLTLGEGEQKTFDLRIGG